MEDLLQDLRYSFRSLLKHPGFAAIAVLTLMLGIGANTAIFTVVNAVLLNPLPYDESDRLVFLSERSPQMEGLAISLPNFVDWREQSTSFEHIGVYRRADSYTLVLNDLPEQVTGATLSADLLSALRVKPRLGRIFSPEEDKLGAEPVVLLSYGLWQRGFAADTNVVGQKLTMSGKPYTVVGVMGDDFAFPAEAELWVPIGPQFNNVGWQERGNHPGVYGVGRLRSGVTIDQARAEMNSIAENLEHQYPESNTGVRVNVSPLLDTFVRDIRPLLWALLGTVGFVLLIACANVANLLLGRSAARQKEIAIRGALGASRPRLIRQLLTESVLLSLAGAALGVLVAHFGVKALVAVNPTGIPRSTEIRLDVRVLGVTLLVAVLTGIIFGLVPALRASKLSMGETLKEGGQSSTAGLRQRLRRGLVISEVALAIVPLIGAGLMIRSFARLSAVDPGFTINNLLSLQVNLPRAQYTQASQRVNFYRQLVDRLAALPDVRAAGVATGLPLGKNGNQVSFGIVGQPDAAPGQSPLAEVTYVSNDYFRAMNIPVLQGRTFTDHDNKDAPPVVIIDDSFAKQYWPDEDPLGKQVKFERDGAPRTVIGVVGRVRMEGLDVDSGRVQAYFSYLVSPWGYTMSVVARTSGNPASLGDAVRHEVLALDKDRPIFNVKTVERVRNESVATRRLNTLLFGVFAGIALLLASIGIYGVMSYSVAQRTREIGIRIALGADRRDVLKLVMGQGIVLAVIGVALGLSAALGLTRWMQTLLFGVSVVDLMTFVSIPVIIIGVAMLACFVPARRALKVDPIDALRYE
jgi:putative ABC transport system permease protein